MIKQGSEKQVAQAAKIFGLAFGLNLLWENLHARLYAYYQHGPITELILLRAAFFDAVFISAILIAVTTIPFFIKHQWRWTVVIGLVLAVLVERYALTTDRWAYTNVMPVIPVLQTGLTPTIQLGLLAIITAWLIAPKRNRW